MTVTVYGTADQGIVNNLPGTNPNPPLNPLDLSYSPASFSLTNSPSTVSFPTVFDNTSTGGATSVVPSSSDLLNSLNNPIFSAIGGSPVTTATPTATSGFSNFLNSIGSDIGSVSNWLTSGQGLQTIVSAKALQNALNSPTGYVPATPQVATPGGVYAPASVTPYAAGMAAMPAGTIAGLSVGTLLLLAALGFGVYMVAKKR